MCLDQPRARKIIWWIIIVGILLVYLNDREVGLIWKLDELAVNKSFFFHKSILTKVKTMSLSFKL